MEVKYETCQYNASYPTTLDWLMHKRYLNHHLQLQSVSIQ